MVKLIIGLLILVIAVLGAVLLVKDDPGFVLIKYGDFSLETSLAFGIVAIVVAGVLIQLVLRILLSIWRLPQSLGKNAAKRRTQKSRKLLNQGLIDLAEGRFAQAETALLKLIEHAENPLLNYLAAARAAQQQAKYDERDDYIKSAHDARPEAEIAISVTQAELQLSSGQTERALATLTHLRTVAPKHDYILKLLAKVYDQIGEWSQLSDLLPEVRKKKLFDDARLNQIELKAYSGSLNDAASISAEALNKAWSGLPKSCLSQAEYILLYIDLLTRHNYESKQIEQIVVKSISQQWDSRLIGYYGKLKVQDTSAQLSTAEKWLQDYGSSDVLLLALGRICLRLKLWGKSQSYLEASIGIKSTPESCLELAELLSSNQMNEKEKACRYFQQGLKASL